MHRQHLLGPTLKMWRHCSKDAAAYHNAVQYAQGLKKKADDKNFQARSQAMQLLTMTLVFFSGPEEEGR